MGVSVAPMSVEVAVIAPPYRDAYQIRAGRLLAPEELKAALNEAQATAVLLGGSAAFNAAGATHFGVRKLISSIMGVTYKDSEWLPERTALGGLGRGHDVIVPIWICRASQDDPCSMLMDYIRRHSAEQPRRAA